MKTRLLFIFLLSLMLPVHGWAAVAFGTKGAVNAGTTSVNYAYPASIAANDLLVLCVINKYPTNAPTAPSSPWVTPSNNQGTGDPGDGPGADVGATYATIYYKIADGTESGNLTVSVPSANVQAGLILRYTNATGAWLAAAANGGDATSGTAWSATMGTDPGILGGDMVITCSGFNNSSASATVEALAQTGVTFGTMTEQADTPTSVADNIRVVVSDHAVTSVTTPSGSVVYTMTSSANTAGGTAILRLREDVAATPLRGGAPIGLFQ